MGFVKGRLGIMMFLQYAVWGFWLPVLGAYLQADTSKGGLGFSPGQVGLILGLAASSGALTAPFLAGQLADRYFSTEKFLAVLLVIGGALQWIVSYQTSFGAWLALSVVYSICYQPTIALTNSLAFSHLKDAKNDFPMVRVWGTIGWIAASWIFPMVWLLTDLKFQWLPPFYAGIDVPDQITRTVDAMKFSGTLSIVYAVFCLFLPHTPPKKDAVESLAVTKAFALLKRPSFAVLVAASLPISIVHSIYFWQTAPFLTDAVGINVSSVQPAMSIGQFAEIFVMAALGLMLTRLGFRTTLIMGGMAYVLRYAIFGTFAFLPTEVVVASQALHGFCFSCFFATAFIYVDRIADIDVRHSAQTVFGIIILGIGPVIAAPTLDFLTKNFKMDDGTLNYSALWYTLSAIALVTTLFVGAFFRDETSGRDGSLAAEEEPAVG